MRAAIDLAGDGEPVPVKVEKGDALVSGCVNTSGLLKMRVEKALEDSMVTRILDSVEHAAASKPKIDKFITRFARVYTPFVVVLGACNCDPPIACDRKLELLGVYSADIFSYQLSMCTCTECAACVFLRNRSRFQKRDFIQGRCCDPKRCRA